MTDRGRIDVIKLDIEGHETQFLAGGKSTLTAHRPVIVMEVNRVHHRLRGIDFDVVVPALLPERYLFAARQ